MSGGPSIVLGCCLLVLCCGAPPIQSPEPRAAQDACPSTERILEDVAKIEGVVGALNSLSASPSADGGPRCTVELQLGKGSILWASGSLDYERVADQWRLANSEPSLQKTRAGFIASLTVLADETCACKDAQCLQTVREKAQRTVVGERLRKLVEEGPPEIRQLEISVAECTRHIVEFGAGPGGGHQSSKSEEGQSAQCKQVCQKETECAAEGKVDDTDSPYDFDECVAACTTLVSDSASRHLVEEHLECARKAAGSCEKLMQCR
jgi:hypothetical protein